MTVGVLCCRRFCSISNLVGRRCLSSNSTISFITKNQNHFRKQIFNPNLSRFPQQVRFISVANRRQDASSKADEEELLELLGVSGVKKIDPTTEINPAAEVSDVPATVYVESAYDPFKYLTDLVEQLHSSVDISYGVLIVGSVAMIRILTAYSYYKSERTDTNILANYEENAALLAQWNEALTSKNKLKEQSAVDQYARFGSEKGIMSARDSIILCVYRFALLTTQLSIWYRLALRHAAGMSTEGFAWFKDLTIADPTIAFPLALTWTSLIWCILKIQRQGVNLDTINASILYLATAAMSIPCFYFIQQMPMAFSLCWATNLAISLSFIGAFRIPVVRRMLKLQNITKNVEFQTIRDNNKGYPQPKKSYYGGASRPQEGAKQTKSDEKSAKAKTKQ